jgi:hypothetical protein
LSLVLSDIKNKWHKAKTCFLFENFGGSLHLTSFVLLLSILLPLLHVKRNTYQCLIIGVRARER